jgi:membrane protein YqaA with SNARE-associated domain
MLNRLYASVLRRAASPYAGYWLALIAFAEASLFPVPPDALLLPMALARPARAWRYALICTLASVLGGALGYAIGYYLFDRLAQPVLRFYGYGDRYAAFQALYREWGLWVVLIKGLTPIPYKIVTIASGAAHFNFPVFMAASLATRGLRFFLVAGLIRAFGPSIAAFIERRLMLVTVVAVSAVAGGFILLKML